MVQTERATQTPPGEPLYTEKMSLCDRGGSVGVTIPSAAVKILGYEVGDVRDVEVHRDGVWIPRREVGDE